MLYEVITLTLRERTVHHHAIGNAAGDCSRGVLYCTGRAAATTAPEHVRVAQLFAIECGRQPWTVVTVVRERGEAIDLLW